MKRLAPRWLRGRHAVIGVPYAWLLLFFLFPFLILVKISVSEMETVTFKDLITFKEGLLQLTLKLSNYVFITEDALYIKTYLASLKYAAAAPAQDVQHRAHVPGIQGLAGAGVGRGVSHAFQCGGRRRLVPD